MSSAPDSTVEVVPYSESWPAAFSQERAALLAVAGNVANSIEHIGSTAVPGLSAKPTIDILMVVDSIEAFRDRIPDIEAIGYEFRARNMFVGSDAHLFLRKVVEGKRTHHLHVLRSDSAEIEDYRLFRDTLRAKPDVAARNCESTRQSSAVCAHTSRHPAPRRLVASPSGSAPRRRRP